MELTTMDMLQIFHMNKGQGEESYAKNCTVQNKILSLTKSFVEEAIQGYLSNELPETMVIADLGCSSGPTALGAVSEIINMVNARCRKMEGHSSSPKFMVFLNDLPGNDFNGVFGSLNNFQNKLKEEKGGEFEPCSCFVAGLPGSFYGRLLPNKTLHFVHSSSSLHWLSQVPAGLDDKDNAKMLNKGKIYMSMTSPNEVINAYKLQFRKDFLSFLKCRAEEVISGGRMVLTFMGRRSNDSTSEHNNFYPWELIARSFNSMVSEGLIEEDKVDNFNVPYYAPCLEEVKQLVEEESSFFGHRFEAVEVEWDGDVKLINNNQSDEHSLCKAALAKGERVAKIHRAVVESMLEHYFGKNIMDDLFQRYGNCFKTHIFGETHVFVASTESAKEILSNDLGKFTKKYIRSIGEVIGSESLLCASHQTHKLIRRHLLDLFNSNSIADFTKQFDQLVVDSLNSWKNTGNVIILDQALKITFKAMCKMLLSLEDGSELSMLQKDVACVCHGMLAFPLNLPWTTFSKGLKARKRIMNLLEKMIQERRARHSTQIPYGHGNTDFLQYLLLGKNREPCSSDSEPSLTDAQIKDNILTMIIAGQDTTASAMTWMVKYLDENQGVLKVVQDEVLSLQKRVATKSSLTLEDLNEMTYAAKVVKESLRMASIVPWFPRVALRDCNILGYTIKKGWNINVDARAIHFDPTLHKDPHKFIPSRFDNEPKPYTYLAFGAGGRTCLGMNLARTMMLVFIYRLITTYKWEVTDPDSSVENWALFSRLKSGCPIQITRINNETRIKDN